MGGNKDNGIHTFNNLFHNLSNSDFTKEEKIMLALGLKYKPPQLQSSNKLSVVRQKVACYLNKIREAKSKHTVESLINKSILSTAVLQNTYTNYTTVISTIIRYIKQSQITLVSQ